MQELGPLFSLHHLVHAVHMPVPCSASEHAHPTALGDWLDSQAEFAWLGWVHDWQAKADVAHCCAFIAGKHRKR